MTVQANAIGEYQGPRKGMLLAPHNVVVDQAFQCRMAINAEMRDDLKRYADEARIDKVAWPNPPIICMELEEGVYTLIIGFTRFDAAVRAGLEDIKVEVWQGTREDAIYYSTGSNRGQTSSAMTRDDYYKSIKMLIGEPAYRDRATGWLADHIGCGQSTARRYIVRACDELGISRSDMVLTRAGQQVPSRQPRDSAGTRNELNPSWKPVPGRPFGKSKVGGKAIYGDEAKIRSYRDRLVEAGRSVESTVKSPQSIIDFLAARGIAGYAVAAKSGGSSTSPGCIRCFGHVLRGLVERDEIHDAVGRLWRATRILGETCQPVILCYRPNFEQSLLRSIEAETGVLFLSPDELIERIRAEAGGEREAS